MSIAWRLLAVAVITAVLVSGLPVAPAPLAPKRAEAQTGTPFPCTFPASGVDWAPVPTIRASVNASGGSTTDDTGYDPSMSPDGRFLSYSSYSTQHVANDSNDDVDVFLYDRLTKTTERVSVSRDEMQARGGSVASSVSANGNQVAFSSEAANLVGGDADTAVDFMGPDGRMRPPNETMRGSTTLSIEAWFKTTQSGPIFDMTNVGYPSTPSQSNPALYVDLDGKLRGGFWTGAVNQVISPGVVNDDRWHHAALTGGAGSMKLYLDGALLGTKTGTINHLAMSANYVGFGYSTTGWPRLGTGWLSFEGRIDEATVYRSVLSATNVLAHYNARANDPGALSYSSSVIANTPYAYYRMGEASGSAQNSSGPAAAAGYGGSYVGQGANGALTTDRNDVDDIFVRDRVTGTTEIVSVNSSEVQTDPSEGSYGPVISADGTKVAFYTDDKLEASDTNGTTDVYVRDRTAGTTERVSVTSSEVQSTGSSYFQAMSADARFIVFNTSAKDFDPATDTNTFLDVYIRDRLLGTTTYVSKDSGQAASNGNSYFPTVSADGTKVAFYSYATDLVSGDTNGVGDVFVRDVAAASTTRASRRHTGAEATGGSFYPSISSDGRTVAYYSQDAQIVSGDANAVQDVFAYDVVKDTNSLVSLGQDSQPANGASDTFSPGVVSADGRTVAFSSVATNLIGTNNDLNGFNDVFMRDRGAAGGWDLTSTLGSDLVAQSDESGLEQHMPFKAHDLGSGQAYVQLRNGNVVAAFEDAVIPAQGLNVVVRHAHNSLRSTLDTGAGKGWNLSVSDVEAGLEGAAAEAGAVDAMDVNAPINTSSFGTVVAGAFQAAGQLVEFTDGDGTTHRFVRRGGPCGRWESPPGISLRIREEFDATPISGIPDAYEFVRPDGVVYRAERQTALGAIPTAEWRVVSVTDRRGNQLTYEHQNVGGVIPAYRLRYIRHNRAPSEDLVRFDYTGSSLDKIVTLPGFSAPDPATGTSRSWQRTIDYTIDASKHLTRVENVEGGVSTNFAYTGDELSSVTDPRSNATQLAYASGKLSTLTDRRGKPWTYGYSTGGGDITTTTATSPVDATTTSATTYTVSPRAALADGRIAGGNVTSITDAGHGSPNTPVTANYEWTANRLTKSSDGAGNESSFEYNDLGLATRVTRPAPNEADNPDTPDDPTSPIVSKLAYRYPLDYSQESEDCADPGTGGPVSSEGWCAAVAELVRVTAADSVAAQRRISDFTFDDVGNMTRATQRANPDPAQPYDAAPSGTDRSTGFTYYDRGGLKTLDGPRSDVTPNDVTTWGELTDLTYGGYDRTGMPKKITDAVAKAKTFAYTPYGAMGKVTDRDGRVTTTGFDERDNMISAKDAAGHATAYLYDANDNPTRVTRPGGAYATTAFDASDRPTTVSLPGPTGADPRVEADTTYFDDGTTNNQESLRGANTTLEYWPNRLPKKATAPAGTGSSSVTERFYDVAGRAVRTVLPVTNAAGERPETNTTYNPDGSVNKIEQTSASGAVDRVVISVYNAHGEQLYGEGPRTVAGIKQATKTFYDHFGQTMRTERLKAASSWITSSTTYDLAGNVTTQSQPTGFSGAPLTSAYGYDALGRLAAQTQDPSNTDHTVEFAYDGEGLQTSRTDKVSGLRVRDVVTAYNVDGRAQSLVATDYAPATQIVQDRTTSCNYDTAAADDSGYDEDGNLLVTRTLTAGDCTTGTLQRRQTFSYDDRSLVTSTSQQVRSPDTGALVSRTQDFGYESDGSLLSLEHGGDTTTFGRSPAGWVESVTDWRGRQSTSTYLPSGAVSDQAVGKASGTPVATGSFEWTADGVPKLLRWRKNSAGDVVREHTSIAYDVGGMRTSETVKVRQPTVNTLDGDAAAYDYDLLDRLAGWTSPHEDPGAEARLEAAYTLDDGGNLTGELTTKVGGGAWKDVDASYASGRLTSQDIDEPPAETDHLDAFVYDGLGQETSRSVDPAGATPAATTQTTTYDSVGHVRTTDDKTRGDDDVTYVHDASDRPVSRVEPNAARNHLRVDGSPGSKASTPDAANLTSTDLDLRVAVAADQWTETPADGPPATLLGKWGLVGADTKSYRLGLNPNGSLQLAWSDSGLIGTPSQVVDSPVITDVGNGKLVLVRATLDTDNGSGDHVVKIYVRFSTPERAAADIDDADHEDWVQVHSETRTGTTTVADSLSPVTIGEDSGVVHGNLAVPFAGRVYAAQVRNGISGTVVVDPDFSRPTEWPDGATSATDRAGKTWTLGGTAAIADEPARPGDHPTTTLYFTWGASTLIAEETDGTGETLARYVPEGDGQAIAQQTFKVKDGVRDTADGGEWRWLLPDASGNAATHLRDSGEVAEQAAWDPFGRATTAGSSETDERRKGSTLGFQSSPTDHTTGSVLLGARQYDPKTARFTAPDFFVAGSLDLAVGSDSLTGNRYVFAAANPVAFYENGYWPSLRSVLKVAAIGGAIAAGIACGATVVCGIAVGAAGAAALYAADKAGTKDWRWRDFALTTAVGGLLGGVAGKVVPIVGKVVGKVVGTVAPKVAKLTSAVAEKVRSAAARVPLGGAQTINQGVYEVTAASGKTYVGQSGNIAQRLARHIAEGKVSAADAAKAVRTHVPGGRTGREIGEQLRINELGGVGQLENVRNPIGAGRAHLTEGFGAFDDYLAQLGL